MPKADAAIAVPAFAVMGKKRGSELLQNGNALLRGGVGGEERVHEPEQAMLHLVGLTDKELRHVGPLHIVKTRIGRDLSEGRGQRQRIAAELRPTCVGHILALAADGEAGKEGEDVGDETAQQANGQEGDDSQAGATTIVVVVTA